MTDLQRAEFAIILQGFRENKKPRAVNAEGWRLSNLETAIEQMLDVLAQPRESGSKNPSR
jgi:hypothetical protein